MNKRRIIMIGTIIIVALIALIMYSEKNTKTLKCTTNGDFNDMESESTLLVEIKKNKIKDMNITIDVKIPKEYESQKDSLIASIQAQGKMKASSTKDGMELTADMNSGYFDVLGLNKESSYNELKEVLELQGYTCK